MKKLHAGHFPQEAKNPPSKLEHETPPLPQGHRNALGEKVDGMNNPNGAESGSKKSLVAGQRKTW